MEHIDTNDLRATVERHLAADGLSVRDLSKAAAIRPDALAAWLTGKTDESASATIESQITAYLEKAPAQGRPAPDAWIETPTSARFCSLLAYCQAYGRMGVVCGGPGLGKTLSIRHFAASYADVWVATCSPMISGLVPALEEIAESVGITNAGGGARQIARSIARKVEVAPRGLLILDEAQHLTISAVEAVRAIHDQTQLGVAFVGNEAVVRFGSKAQHAHFAQITSRLGMRVFAAKPTEGDVRAVAKHHGVTDRAAVALLVKLSSQPGALRSVSEVVRLARRAGGKVDEERVREAIEHLGGEA